MYNITDFNMNYFSLAGKNAIVTGGNTGLGQAFSLALATAGANIFAPTIMDDNGETKKLVEDRNVKMEIMVGDMTQKGFPKKIVQECVNKFGSVDILVNCAGMCINRPNVLDFTRDEWDKMIALNLTAAFEMSYEVAHYYIPQKSGKIINICSMFSFLGGQWSPAYSASNHGIAGLTKAYCDELAQFNVQVNGIAPGYFATPITKDTRANPESNQRVLNHIPTNRWGGYS